MGIFRRRVKSKTSSTTYAKFPRISNYRFVISTLKWRRDREKNINQNPKSYDYTRKSYDNIHITDEPGTSRSSYRGFNKPSRKPRPKSKPQPKPSPKPTPPPRKKLKTQVTSTTDVPPKGPYRPQSCQTQPTSSKKCFFPKFKCKDNQYQSQHLYNPDRQIPFDLCKCPHDNSPKPGKYIYPVPAAPQPGVATTSKFPVRVVFIKETPSEDVSPCQVPLRECTPGRSDTAPNEDSQINQAKQKMMQWKQEMQERRHQQKMERMREKNRLDQERKVNQEKRKKDKKRRALVKKIIQKRKRCLRSRRPCRYRDSCVLENLRPSEMELLKDDIAYGHLTQCVTGLGKLKAACNSANPCPRTSCTPGCSHGKIPKCNARAVCTNYPCSDKCRGECWKEAALKWTTCKKVEFILLVIATTILLWVCFGLLYHWIVHYRYGFNPVANKDRTEYKATRGINRHILFMTGGLITMNGFSIIIYRTIRWLPTSYSTIVHGLLTLASLGLMIIGILDAKDHNKTMTKVWNFKMSFHRWVGYFTVFMFVLHIVSSVIVFIVLSQLKCAISMRRDFESIHKAIGLYVFVLCAISCGTGANYYGLNLLGHSYLKERSKESNLLSAFSICTALVTVCIFLIVSGSYRVRY